MNKRTFSIFVLFTYSCFISYSCIENPVISVPDLKKKESIDSEIHKINIEDYGTIHNNVLIEMNKRFPFLCGKKVRVKDYINISRESINYVFKQHNININVIDRDIIEIINYFIELRDLDIANVFTIPTEIPYNLFNHFIDIGVLRENEAAYCIETFKEIRDSYKQKKLSQVHTNIINKNAKNKKEKIFYCVVLSSLNYWSNLHSKSINIKNKVKTVSRKLDTWIEPEKFNALMTLYWDGTWGCVGLLFGGIASIIAMIVASTVYIIWGDDIMGPLNIL